jgi:hypothetical protein
MCRISDKDEHRLGTTKVQSAPALGGRHRHHRRRIGRRSLASGAAAFRHGRQFSACSPGCGDICRDAGRPDCPDCPGHGAVLVSVRSQIDGKLSAVKFVEGQEVRHGDVVAEIDGRPLKATLDQAIAKKAEDEAQLAAAQKDLDRYQVLLQRQAVPRQQFDQQQAKVDQLKATVSADQAAIDGAQVQFSYATIAAPIDGRAGVRQVDPGNIVHASDTNLLTILTLVHPVAVMFSLPQSKLFDVHEAMLRGPVTTCAYRKI